MKTIQNMTILSGKDIANEVEANIKAMAELNAEEAKELAEEQAQRQLSDMHVCEGGDCGISITDSEFENGKICSVCRNEKSDERDFTG